MPRRFAPTFLARFKQAAFLRRARLPRPSSDWHLATARARLAHRRRCAPGLVRHLASVRTFLAQTFLSLPSSSAHLRLTSARTFLGLTLRLGADRGAGSDPDSGVDSDGGVVVIRLAGSIWSS